MINKRIQMLRQKMAERGITIYVVPTSDFHESEYVGDYFKARKFITGFTGSAGTAVITMDQAGLWTDGRYFIQAAAQLANSEVELFKMGEENVPTVIEFIRDHLVQGGGLGFDGRVINGRLGTELKELAEQKKASFHTSQDLVGMIWEERPAMPMEPVFLLEEQYTGESTTSKIKRVREKMKQSNADVHILTSLDDIAWVLNIRGNDIPHFPVVLSFLAITQTECCLFIHSKVLSESVRMQLEQWGITICDYEAIYSYVAQIEAKKTVWMDCDRVNFNICNQLNSEVKVLNQENPTVRMKAIKNPVELENLRNAHVEDGVAFTKFMYWLKTNVGKIPMTEITASDYLAERRKEREGFLDLSFDTIAAYEANGAMMHYCADPESAAVLEPRGFLLVDSGGHYYQGTTDITRTMALGPITEKQREYFTIVLRSNLNLAAAKFLYGCNGHNLDILSRGPLWELGLDYKCGTGHGVGYLLNVHEAPNGFRWKIVPERKDSAIFEEGMVTTDEPGVYLEGEYGIRTENELVCCKAEKNEYGQFMKFETITYAPIDLDAIDPELLTKREKQLLNDYHHMVYEKLSPYLTEEEQKWLQVYTRAV